MGAAPADGPTAYTDGEHGVWWLIIVLGIGIVVLGLFSGTPAARRTGGRAATLFDLVEAPAVDARPCLLNRS